MTLSEPKKTIDALLEHRQFVKSIARRCSHDRTAAQDLEQEAWLAALRKPPGDDASPRGWLAQVVRNLAISRTREQRRRSEREARASLPDAGEATDVTYQSELLREDLTRAIENLPELERKVIELHYGEQKSLAETGRRLGLPAKRVAKLSVLACQRMRRELNGHDSKRWGFVLPLGSSARWNATPFAALALRWAIVLALLPAGVLLWKALSMMEPGTSRSSMSTREGEDVQDFSAGLFDSQLYAQRDDVQTDDDVYARAGASAEAFAPGVLGLEVKVLCGINHQPCEDAQVFVAELSDTAAQTLLGTTDSSGALLTTARDTRVWIGARHPDWGPSLLIALETLIDTSYDQAEVELRLTAPPRRLFGQVINERGEPLSGARIALEYSEARAPRFGLHAAAELWPPTDSTFSDEQGRYELHMARIANQRVRISHPDYAVQVEALRRAKQEHEYNAVLQPSSIVSGRITNAFGVPAAGVVVTAQLPWNASLSTTTDEQGLYELTQLPIAAHVLSAQGTTFSAAGSAREVFDFEPGTRVSWSPQLEDQACITGRVAGLSELESGEWRVMLEPEGALHRPGSSSLFGTRVGARFAQLDRDGAFAFSSCAPQAQRLTLQHVAPDGSIWPDDVLLGVRSGERELLLTRSERAYPAATATLAGKLPSTLVGGATVLLSSTGRATCERLAIDAETREFRFEGLPAGDYRLWASTAGRNLIALHDSRVICLKGGEVLELGTLELPEPASIVLDTAWPEGDRLGYATVRSTDSDLELALGLKRQRALENLGESQPLVLSRLEAGEYVVTVWSAVQMRHCETIQLESGESRTLHVDMSSGSEVRLECLARSEALHAGFVRMRLFTGGGGLLRDLVLEPCKQRPGYFSKTLALSAGEFRVESRDSRGRSAEQHFVVEANDQAKVVTLDPR